MRIAVGSDHRGLKLKSFIIAVVTEEGHQFKDFGGYTPEPVDYPDIAQKVGEAVARGDFERGILICDTGIGMSIAANKLRGIRAALCHDVFCAQRARLHNDANILCLGTSHHDETVRKIVNAFLNTSFEGGRHIPRLNKIETLKG